MKEKIMEIWGIILDILFPPVCLVCRRKLLSNELQPNLSEKISRSQAPEDLRSCLEEYPAAPTGLVFREAKAVGAREKKFRPLESEYSGSERQLRKSQFWFSKASLAGVCSSCSQKIKINNTPFCPVCFARLPENKKICHFDSQFILAAAGSYEDENLRQLITLLKYQKIKTAAVPLAEILTQYLIRNLALDIRNFLIVPIPLHWRREKKRGFNQSDLIADQLSKNSGLPVVKNILKRIKNTPSQVGLKEKEKREINVQNCFVVEKPELLFWKNVILLDDVFTSGATMKEAVKAIKKAGAKKIIGLVVAKTN